MNMGSSTRLCFGPIMGTDIDAALDEVYYGRNNRHDGGIPASLGARTSYDIKYAHQRMRKRQEAERVEAQRQAKKDRAHKKALERIHLQEIAQTARVAAHQKAHEEAWCIERRRQVARNEVFLWQREGWEPWWELLGLAARKPAIQQADYNETGAEADTVRYFLLQAHVKEVALERGYSENMAKAVAAAIFIKGIPHERNLTARSGRNLW